MAPFARRDQRGAAVAVGAFQVRAMVQRQCQDLAIALRARQQVRAVLHLVLRVHVGARFDQDARGL
ncbi:hypothetical protein D3C71_1529020 [compost metagenome]